MKNETLSRGLFFLAGAAAGFALGMYLRSEKGSDLREQLSEHLDDLLQNLGDRVEDQLGDLITNLGAAAMNGLQQMAQPANSAAAASGEENSLREDVQEALDEAEENFENGMEKARARLMKKFAAAGLTTETTQTP